MLDLFVPDCRSNTIVRAEHPYFSAVRSRSPGTSVTSLLLFPQESHTLKHIVCTFQLFFFFLSAVFDAESYTEMNQTTLDLFLVSQYHGLKITSSGYVYREIQFDIDPRLPSAHLCCKYNTPAKLFDQK